MTLFKTNAEIVRDNSAAILALASAHKADGTPFTYREILRAVGLPETRTMERTLSGFLIQSGARRVPFAFRKHGPELPEVADSLVEIEPAEEAPQAEAQPSPTLWELFDRMGQSVTMLQNTVLDLMAALNVKPAEEGKAL